MPTVRYGEPLNVVVAAKGHPYSRDAFMAIFDQIPGIACTLVEQPAVQRLMNPQAMAGFERGLGLQSAVVDKAQAAEGKALGRADRDAQMAQGFDALRH